MAGAPAIPSLRPTVHAPAPTAGRSSLRRERILGLAAVIIPCVVGTVLAFYDITARSLWLDEAASVAIASQHGIALWHAMEHDGGNMLGYYALLHLVLKLFGDGTLAIRFVSALATGATATIVSLLARRLFDRRVALAAGLLTAISLPLVYWGQDARSYALMVTFVCASFFFLLALLDPRPHAPPGRWTWVAYVMSTVLAAYMSFEALLIVPAQLLALVWMMPRRSLRSVLSAMVTAGVCCLPVLVLAERRGSGQLFWVPRPNLAELHQTLEALLSSGLEPNFHLTSTGTPLLVLTGVLLLGIAVLVGRRASRAELLVLCWLLVPVALAVLESYIVQPITLPRAVLISLPAASLLLARGALDSRIPRLLGVSSIGVVLVLRALQLVPSYGVSPENWRAATAHVLAAARPGDCIAFYPSDGRQAFSYYVGNHPAAAARAPRSVLPLAPWSELKPYVEVYTTLTGRALARIEAACPRLWFVSSHNGTKNGPAASRSDYAQYRTLLGSLTLGYSAGRTITYGWASPVRVELFRR